MRRFSSILAKDETIGRKDPSEEPARGCVACEAPDQRMPITEVPAKLNEPEGSAEPRPQSGSAPKESSITGSILGLDTFSERDLEPRKIVASQVAPRELAPNEPEVNSLQPHETPPPASSSRWVDYNTHELLQMISDLEDERRWARLREGFWLALLFHIALFSAITWIPTYLFKVPKVIDPFDAIKQRKDLAYLDLPPDAIRQSQPKVTPRPLPNKPLIDKQTLEDMKRQAEQAPAPPPPPPAAQQEAPAPEQTRTQPAQPIPPSPQSQAPEAPRPQAVPAKPNFALGSANTADQLREDMQKAMQDRGQPSYGSQAPSGGLSMHPGAGTGQPDILSDTQGVDFSSWLARWHYVTQRTWDPLIPDEVNPPILKSGVVAVRFKVLPNGQVIDMQLDGRSGDTGLDRAAWGAIIASSYPPLPREFHGPYLELRAYFLYNMEPR
jgi:TonB family protein